MSKPTKSGLLLGLATLLGVAVAGVGVVSAPAIAADMAVKAAPSDVKANAGIVAVFTSASIVTGGLNRPTASISTRAISIRPSRISTWAGSGPIRNIGSMASALLGRPTNAATADAGYWRGVR